MVKIIYSTLNRHGTWRTSTGLDSTAACRGMHGAWWLNLLLK
jgi:hypothetical protein